MILADTSVWADHLRRGNAGFHEALEEGHILMHPFVQGELTLGHARRRGPLLELIAMLPTLEPATHAEVIEFVTDRELEGSGVGWVDAHLLAASLLHGATLWTLDKKLRDAAKRLGLA